MSERKAEYRTKGDDMTIDSRIGPLILRPGGHAWDTASWIEGAARGTPLLCALCGFQARLDGWDVSPNDDCGLEGTFFDPSDHYPGCEYYVSSDCPGQPAENPQDTYACECPDCEGREVTQIQCGPDGCRTVNVQCSRCKGTGRVSQETLRLMEIGENFRAYRRGLKIPLTRAARILGLKSEALSWFEHGYSGLPADRIQRMRRDLAISANTSHE